ncbi:MAG: GUN4 domain-containing protein [Cyanobacteria bacterium J06623_4]
MVSNIDDMSTEDLLKILLSRADEPHSSENTDDSSHELSIYDDDEIILESDVGIDYSNLQKVLSKRRFRQADKMTYDLICKAVSKPVGSYFTSEDIRYFPEADLLTLDKLWNYYSNGMFGFTVQREFFNDASQDLPTFKYWVGWKDNILQDHDYPADKDMLEQARPGFLPCLCNWKGKVLFITNQIIVHDFAARLDTIAPD